MKPQEQDEALQALSNELAAYKKEKEASQTHLANGFLPIPKNRRVAAAQQKRGGLLAASKHLHSLSPSSSASRTTAAPPTSAPVDSSARRTRAMRTALMHYLAMGDASTADIVKATHITDNEVKELLKTMAHLVDRKWRLSDKSFKELDVWRFKYAKDEHRKAAIDNAIRAFDRMRLSKDDKLWQLLLHKSERGHGKVLSRLHLTTNPQQALTPRIASPLPQSDFYQSSAANTPQLGPSGTPKITASKKPNGDVMKRLMSKDPKKARAVDEAREKKRKDRESQDSAADARPAKVRVIAGKNKQAAKSEELVHSSEDDEELNDNKVNSSINRTQQTSKALPHARSHSRTTSQSAITSSQGSKTGSSPADRPDPGKLTPHLTHSKPSAVRSRSHISPPKPTAPSPLGAVRPRVSSDVTDRSGISGHKRSNTSEGVKGPSTTDTTARKRHDTVTSMESNEEIRSKDKTSDGMAKSQMVQTSQDPQSQQNSRKSSASTSAKTQSSEDRFDGGTSDSSTSFIDTMSFSQGLDLAEQFKTQFYPAYAKLYDSIADKRQRGEAVSDQDFDRLYKMQARLEQMKQEIESAAERKNKGNSS